jgi:signal recognition particle subunit SEC65
MSYENDGLKAGVVYPCGAAVIGERLFVYYGGADMVVCVASAKLKSFLEQLVTYHKEKKPESIPAQSPIKSDKTDEIREAIQGFCLKCRRTREIKNPRHVILNKRHAVQGICPKCGGKISRLIKSRSDIDQDKLLESQIKNKKHKKG